MEEEELIICMQMNTCYNIIHWIIKYIQLMMVDYIILMMMEITGQISLMAYKLHSFID